MLPKLTNFGLAKVLLRALAGNSQHQAAIVRELRRLNDNIDRIYPVPAARPASVEEVPQSFEDEVADLAEAADAEQVLVAELGRSPSVEEILERVRARRERRETVTTRGPEMRVPIRYDGVGRQS